MTNREEYLEAQENARIEREYEMAEIIAYYNDLERSSEVESEAYGLLTLEKV